MRRIKLVMAMVAGLAFAANSAIAAPIVVNWQSETFTSDAGGTANSNNFNSGHINFTPFSASELTSITSGGRQIHPHANNPQNFWLEILLDNSWVTLANYFQASPGGTVPLATGFGPLPISFPAGSVSGIRLRSIPGSNQSYHLSNTNFTFNLVPEPASIAVWSVLLLTVVGATFYMRRRNLQLATN